MATNLEKKLQINPSLMKKGALWEGYALEEIIRYLDVRADSWYFWRTEHDAELDLFVEHKGKLLGFEFKYGEN